MKPLYKYTTVNLSKRLIPIISKSNMLPHTGLLINI